ncbi:MAG: hypothetical protein WCT22_05860 [Patescibacteria group bacterium]
MDSKNKICVSKDFVLVVFLLIFFAGFFVFFNDTLTQKYTLNSRAASVSTMYRLKPTLPPTNEKLLAVSLKTLKDRIALLKNSDASNLEIYLSKKQAIDTKLTVAQKSYSDIKQAALKKTVELKFIRADFDQRCISDLKTLVTKLTQLGGAIDQPTVDATVENRINSTIRKECLYFRQNLLYIGPYSGQSVNKDLQLYIDDFNKIISGKTGAEINDLSVIVFNNYSLPQNIKLVDTYNKIFKYTGIPINSVAFTESSFIDYDLIDPLPECKFKQYVQTSLASKGHASTGYIRISCKVVDPLMGDTGRTNDVNTNANDPLDIKDLRDFSFNSQYNKIIISFNASVKKTVSSYLDLRDFLSSLN